MNNSATQNNPAPQDKTVVQEFIDNAVKSGLRMKVFLVSGIKLDGMIVAHDDVCIKMTNREANSHSNTDSPYQLVTKSYIVSIAYH